MRNEVPFDEMIDLNELAGGAFREKVHEALMQVGKNIINPNTEATTKRAINIKMTFMPSKKRQIAATKIDVTTKLAATEALETEMLVGLDMRTGEIEVREYDGNIPGQMSIRDIAATAPEIIDENRPQIVGTVVEEPDPNTPPIDVRKGQKGKRLTGAAALAPIPGVDVDPETGEILDPPNYEKLAELKEAAGV